MAKPVILLVDDNEDLLASLEEWIRIEVPDATLHTFTDGAHGLAAMRQLQPDVVITDLQMPRLGGRDFASMGNQLGWRARFVVLSGASEQQLTEAQRLPNVVGVLRKPLDLDEFRRALARALAT